jgi:uncharacterized RDD family membrane protein YckC
MAGAALPAVSSDDHLWFIVQPSPAGSPLELRHVARESDDPYYTRGLTLGVGSTEAVEAMAAWDNQLWLVFAPTTGETPRRETFTVQVHRNPALESWYHAPHDRLRAVASLEGSGSLAGFTATADGPVALILHRNGPPGSQARLLQLRGTQWHDLPLPDAVGPGTWGLGAAGLGGRTLVLIGEPSRPGVPARVHRLAAGRGWSVGEVPLDLGRLRSLTRVGPNVALIEDRGPIGPVEVAYLRSGGLLRLARFPTPEGRWSVLGMRDGLRLIDQAPRGRVAVSRIDPITGVVGPREVLDTQPLVTGRVLHRPLLLAVGITALMVILLFKPAASAAKIALPEGMVALSPLPRLVAVGVDLAASAAAVLVVFRCPPDELLWWPLWTADLATSAPFLVMIGLTIAHGALTELVAGCTLGKKIVGAKVVAGDGSRPTARAIIVRNALKTIVLLIPVLAVFAILTPHVQGLGDQVAGTVVVRARAAGDDAPPKDR